MYTCIVTPLTLTDNLHAGGYSDRVTLKPRSHLTVTHIVDRSGG